MTLAFVGSNPAIPASAAWFGMNPAANDPLAQPAEQLPFKQWVRSSNLRRVTKKKKGDTFQVSPFFFRLPPKRFERSNRNCPVDSCCHQFKNWWLHLSSFAIAKEDANESPAGHIHPSWVRQTNRPRVTLSEGEQIPAGHIHLSWVRQTNRPVAVPEKIFVSYNDTRFFRPLPLAPLPSSATGSGRVAPRRVTLSEGEQIPAGHIHPSWVRQTISAGHAPLKGDPSRQPIKASLV